MLCEKLNGNLGVKNPIQMLPKSNKKFVKDLITVCALYHNSDGNGVLQ